MDKPLDKNRVHETRLWFERGVWHELKAAIKDAGFWEEEFGKSPGTLQEAVHILVESICEKHRNRGVSGEGAGGISHHTYSENAQSTAKEQFIPKIDVSALLPSGAGTSSIHKPSKEALPEEEQGGLEIDASKLGIEPVIPMKVEKREEKPETKEIEKGKERGLGEVVLKVNGKVVPVKKPSVKPAKIPSLFGGMIPDVKKAHEEGVRAAERVRRLFSSYLDKKHEIEAKYRLKRIDGLSYRRMMEEVKREYEIALKYV